VVCRINREYVTNQYYKDTLQGSFLFYLYLISKVDQETVGHIKGALEDCNGTTLAFAGI